VSRKQRQALDEVLRKAPQPFGPVPVGELRDGWHQGDRAGWTAAPGRCRYCRCLAANTGKSNGLRSRWRPEGRCRRVRLSRPFPGWCLISGRVSGARPGRA